MGVLHIKNIDEAVVSQYDHASTEEKGLIKQILGYWINRDSTNLEKLIEKQKSEENDLLKREALEYADKHPVFPLNWSQNKLTREEMNER